jgi:branched-chain amino acid transport system permease protein
MRFHRAVVPIGLFVLYLVPFGLHDDYLFHVLVMSGIYAILAISLNLLLGCAGLFSLGHGAFYGLGAYFAATVALRYACPFVPALLLSGLFSGLIGALIALPAIRLKGIFLAIGTMGFNEIFRILAINLESITGGPAGIPGIPAPEIFGYAFSGPRDFYVAIVLLCALVCGAFSRILGCRPGRALIAIRDDEIAASAVGIDLAYFRVSAFALSTAVAGMAGGFFAYYMSYISPDNFGLWESFTVLAMVSLGGIGNLFGSIVGAIALVAVPEAFRFLQDYRVLIYGVTIILVVRLLPAGILSWYPGLVARFQKPQAASWQ